MTEVLSDDRVLLEGGRLTGVTEGSRIAFYPIGQGPSDESFPVASGTVKFVEALRAEIVLDTPPTEANLRESWAFVTERAYGVPSGYSARGRESGR